MHGTIPFVRDAQKHYNWNDPMKISMCVTWALPSCFAAFVLASGCFVEPQDTEVVTTADQALVSVGVGPVSVGVGVTTGGGDTDFVCPREDIAATGCRGPKDCLYANPESCNTFIECIPNADGSGAPVVRPCLSGLEWNDNEKQCDWPAYSTCSQ
ncbi:carbohydrate-binding module family 14 protein [Sorangium sp. So ce1389]|uniref:carbohydrate-binding module family 14 protein n=1 Tax=Sorangium sp. So ce1389 TaxID=3133336 RepID=UPI003F6463D0